MNISLSGSKQKDKKKGAAASLGYGLNNRSATATTASGNSSQNVFGDDDDDNSDDEEGEMNATSSSGRQAVNQQIAKEQAALRKRAQAALTAAEDPSMYDYDGAYDSFKTERDQETKQKAAASQEERKSKYIGDLLKAAKVRERERDAIYERRIAREQAEEDAKEEFSGKEKFVTKAYKRKLEERKQWEMEQKVKEREEEANDVTKKSAGAAFASFYGNLNKNVAAGGQADGQREKEEEANEREKQAMDSLDDFDPRGGFMADFEQSGNQDDDDHPIGEDEDLKAAESSSDQKPTEPAMSMRERREKKVAEARIRYLKRREAAMAQFAAQ
jgi:coiled-coil domain-containing protein 55